MRAECCSLGCASAPAVKALNNVNGRIGETGQVSRFVFRLQAGTILQCYDNAIPSSPVSEDVR